MEEAGPSSPRDVVVGSRDDDAQQQHLGSPAEQLQRQQQQLKAAKSASATQQQGSSSSTIIKLNVGGTKYTVGLSTLLADDCSYFSALFSGRSVLLV